MDAPRGGAVGTRDCDAMLVLATNWRSKWIYHTLPCYLTYQLSFRFLFLLVYQVPTCYTMDTEVSYRRSLGSQVWGLLDYLAGLYYFLE